MSPATHEFAHIPDTETLQRYNQMLRITPKPALLYPEPQNGLTKDDIRHRDQQALLTIGAMRQNDAFETLDDWLRYDHRQTTELVRHYKHEPHAPVTAILAAGRYMVQRQGVVLRGAIKPESAAKWNDLFNNQQLVKNAQEDLRMARYGSKYDQVRVDLARLSIFSEMYYSRRTGLA